MREDGRSPGIWDVFCHTGHHIKDGDNADVACDHYHRMPEDVALVARSGVKNYRFRSRGRGFTPSWTARPMQKALRFMTGCWTSCTGATSRPGCACIIGICRNICRRGGWTNRDTSYRLAEFSDRVSRHFGDRIGHWMVLNEAAVHSYLGHGLGFHAPGLTGKENWVAALHHLNLGQGLSIQALRANLPQARVGTVASVEPVRPSTQVDR